MLFMVMHKMTADLEQGLPPSPTIIEDMGKLVGEAQQNGTFVNGAGLHRTARRVRLSFTGGKCTRTAGPLKGSRGVIAGFIMLKVRTMEDAVSWATRIAEAVGDVEIDVGPVVEPWDLGLMPEPKNPPLRVIATLTSDAAAEAGKPPSPEVKGKMDALIAQMKEQGAFLAAERLAPSSRGARLRNAPGKRTWTDGPFTEAKELISGFALMRLGSLEEAKKWTERYADILGEIEVDVRVVIEAYSARPSG